MTQEVREKCQKLPVTAGTYIFKDAGERVIYVGKAKNIKKRVLNHFSKPGQHAFDFISQIADIDYVQTASETEALILEQQLIKKLQPRWNVEWKDDKNYFFIAQTAEPFPRIYLTHQPDSKLLKSDFNKRVEIRFQQRPRQEQVFGPFVSGREVKSFLKEIRKALPYRTCRNLPKKPCFYHSLGLCVAPCEAVSLKIPNLLDGREIPSGARGIYKKRKASYVKMIGTLIALIKAYLGNDLRIEGYDISNLSGTLAVGSMVVFQNGKPDKNQYRKFKIKTVAGQNDVASLKEVLSRRMKHTEWTKPDLILLDGGKGQLKAAKSIDIPVVALAKIKKNDGKLFSPFSKNYSQLSKLPPNLLNLFLQIRNESHRFAISYNKQKREQTIK